MVRHANTTPTSVVYGVTMPGRSSKCSAYWSGHPLLMPINRTHSTVYELQPGKLRMPTFTVCLMTTSHCHSPLVRKEGDIAQASVGSK